MNIAILLALAWSILYTLLQVCYSEFEVEPVQQSVPEYETAVFRCRNSAAISISWQVNGKPFRQGDQDGITSTTRTVYDSDGLPRVTYELHINASIEYNGTTVSCVALFRDSNGVSNETISPEVNLLIQVTSGDEAVYSGGHEVASEITEVYSSTESSVNATVDANANVHGRQQSVAVIVLPVIAAVVIGIMGLIVAVIIICYRSKRCPFTKKLDKGDNADVSFGTSASTREIDPLLTGSPPNVKGVCSVELHGEADTPPSFSVAIHIEDIAQDDLLKDQCDKNVACGDSEEGTSPTELAVLTVEKKNVPRETDALQQNLTPIQDPVKSKVVESGVDEECSSDNLGKNPLNTSSSSDDDDLCVHNTSQDELVASENDRCLSHDECVDDVNGQSREVCDETSVEEKTETTHAANDLKMKRENTPPPPFLPEGAYLTSTHGEEFDDIHTQADTEDCAGSTNEPMLLPANDVEPLPIATSIDETCEQIDQEYTICLQNGAPHIIGHHRGSKENILSLGHNTVSNVNNDATTSMEDTQDTDDVFLKVGEEDSTPPVGTIPGSENKPRFTVLPRNSRHSRTERSSDSAAEVPSLWRDDQSERDTLEPHLKQTEANELLTVCVLPQKK